MKTEVEVTDCRDCPFKKDHYGHGECWCWCSHPGAKDLGWNNILWGCQEEFKRTPDWCPIKKPTATEDNHGFR